MDFIQLGLGRWLHILAGVMWIGLLYYFNFVQVDALKAAAADNTGAGITKHVAPRALLYFRWAAVVTFLAGVMIAGRHVHEVLLFLKPAYYPIGVGAWPGIRRYQDQLSSARIVGTALGCRRYCVWSSSPILSRTRSDVRQLMQLLFFCLMPRGAWRGARINR